jgi:REP element-mobilizing transposase RayT
MHDPGMRVQYEGEYYHVACRGNERRSIFKDDADWAAFLELLERSAGVYDVRVFCYVLMNKWLHLLFAEVANGYSRLKI